MIGLPLFFVITQSVSAEEAKSASEVESLTVLYQMVRWSGLAASVIVIAAAWLLISFLHNLTEQLGVMFVERRLLFQKINAFVRFGIYLSAVVTVVLLSFDFSRDVLAIIGGGTAVAVGFAAKDLVASLVAGMTILVDRPFQVGDRVSFADQYGDIITIGLRSIKIRTLDDNTVTIPNNMFLNGVTSCGNYGVLDMQVVIDFYIGLDQDVNLARQLLREAAATSRFIHLPKPIVVLVSQVALENYIAVRLRLKVYVLDTQYEKELETDINLRVLEAFTENRIQAPAVLHRGLNEDRRESTFAERLDAG